MSASNHQLEAAMQSAWDRGHDPFADTNVLALLDAQPELLEQAAQWRASVHKLQQLPAHLPTATTPRSPASPIPLAWLATAIAAAVLALLWWPQRLPIEAPGQPAQPQLRVLQSSITQRVEHHGSACSVREVRLRAATQQTSSGRFQLTTQLVQRTQTSLTR